MCVCVWVCRDWTETQRHADQHCRQKTLLQANKHPTFHLPAGLKYLYGNVPGKFNSSSYKILDDLEKRYSTESKKQTKKKKEGQRGGLEVP